MLHVDRVLDCVPGERIVGIKNVTRSEPFLGRANQGFVLPHLIVVEALAQLSVVLAFKSLRLEQTGQELVFFAGIDEARFTNSASPGHTLTLYSSVRRMKKLVGWFDARAEVEGGIIAVVSMLAAIRRSEPAAPHAD